MAKDEQENGRNLEDAGFTITSVSTVTEGFEYVAEVPQADSWETYYEFWREEGHNPDEVLTQILNAQNLQTGRQSPKAVVRDAVKTAKAAGEEVSADHPGIAEAVEKANEQSRGYVLGAPRAGGGGGPRHESGLTKKQREEFGGAIGTAMVKKGGPLSEAEQREIAEALGIDPELLNL